MNLRDAKCDLFGMVEPDVGFFSTTVEGDKKEEKKKRGRGSQTSDNPEASMILTINI